MYCSKGVFYCKSCQSMTAGGFLCYTKDVFCLFVSVEIRRNAERHGASSIRRHSAEKAARQRTLCPLLGQLSDFFVLFCGRKLTN